MVKYFCDRCGRELDLKKCAWFRHKTVYADITFYELIYAPGPVDHRICPECEDSFIKWFNHPEEE